MEEEKTKILLVEDDINLGSLLREYLNAKSYQTDLYGDGEAGYRAFRKNQYQLCILDVMMPKKDGFSLAEDIRNINSDIPIIFLTAKTMKEDVFQGFKVGADDYITKPFNMQEVLYRIEAVLRRSQKNQDNPGKLQFTLGDFQFDANTQTLEHNNKKIHLTTKESELLRLLCNNINSVLERDFALKTIWIEDNYFNARSMDVYITKLRKHLSVDQRIKIMNIHGKGYKLLIAE